jgi:hypothetical protein
MTLHSALHACSATSAIQYTARLGLGSNLNSWPRTTHTAIAYYVQSCLHLAAVSTQPPLLLSATSLLFLAENNTHSNSYHSPPTTTQRHITSIGSSHIRAPCVADLGLVLQRTRQRVARTTTSPAWHVATNSAACCKNYQISAACCKNYQRVAQHLAACDNKIRLGSMLQELPAYSTPFGRV